MDGIEIEKALFQSRVQQIVSAWPWSSLDALFLHSGVASDDSQEHKTAALHHWLFGVEFPELVLLLQRSGKLTFWTSQKKLKHLSQVQGADVSLVARASPPNIEADLKQLKEIVATVLENKQKATLGVFTKEKHVGAFGEAIADALPTLPGIEVVDARDGISEILAPKDDIEVADTRGACRFAVRVMQDGLMWQVQDALDDEDAPRPSHAAICGQIDALLDNEAEMKRLSPPDLDIAALDLTYTQAQSGREYVLKHAHPPTEDLLAETGMFLLSLGTRCNEYCACITRSIMVNPAEEQKEAYICTRETQKLVMEMLKPGTVFKDIYIAARASVEKKVPHLASRLVKSLGHITGLEFRDVQAQISEKCERKVTPNTVYVISAGFEPDETGAWAVWLSDTVLVDGQGKTELLTGACGSEPGSIMFEYGDSEPTPQAAPPKAAQKPPPAVPPAAVPKPPPAAVPKPPPAAKAPAKQKAKATPKPKGRSQGKEAKAKEVKEEKRPPPRQTNEPGRRSSRLQPQPTLAGTGIPQPAAGKTRSLRKTAAQVKEDMSEQVRLEAQQKQLRTQKLAEMKKRFAEDGASFGQVNRASRGPQRLADCQAYVSPAEVPRPLARNKLQVDFAGEALLVPYKGAVLPFHCKTIKNMSRFDDQEGNRYLRVNFFFPGQGKSAEEFPKGGPDTVYVKELSFKSTSADNFDKVQRDFKEAQKRMKQKEIEGEVTASTGSSNRQAEVLQALRAPPVIRDMNIRPTMGSGARRMTGSLEAHANALRFSPRGSPDKVEIFYSQVKQAVFQPCEKSSLIVLIHFHLKEAMMVGKRRTFDVQFFTEVASQTEDLAQRRAGNAYDPDEILEEQREEELKQRLNQMFHEFVKKVEAIPTCKLAFELPQDALSFFGVPFKSTVRLFPCARSLVAVQEFPPFCLDMTDVEIVVFERALLNTREFDIVFVKKDYSQSPVRVTMIPSPSLAIIKTWLADMNLIWYTVSMNMQWQAVMKQISENVSEFLEDGGWEVWFGDEQGSESEMEEDEDEGSDYVDEDADDDDEDEDGDGDEDDDEEESSDDADGGDDDSEEESGMSWDEMEKEAERSDRKRDLDRGQENRAAKQPAAKRPRRR